MKIRYAGALALAGALTLAPTAAFAADYPSTTPTLVCNAASFVPGQTITCTVTGPQGTVIHFTVGGGVLSLTKTLGATPTSFSFTVPGGTTGDLEVQAEVDGEVVDTATFTPVTTTEVLSAGPVETASTTLASTGFEGTAMALGGGLLLAGGIVSVAVATRRTASRAGV